MSVVAVAEAISSSRNGAVRAAAAPDPPEEPTTTAWVAVAAAAAEAGACPATRRRRRRSEPVLAPPPARGVSGRLGHRSGVPLSLAAHITGCWFRFHLGGGLTTCATPPATPLFVLRHPRVKESFVGVAVLPLCSFYLSPRTIREWLRNTPPVPPPAPLVFCGGKVFFGGGEAPPRGSRAFQIIISGFRTTAGCERMETFWMSIHV